MAGSQRIAALMLDEPEQAPWHPAIAHARTLALTGLLNENHFVLVQAPAAGPYNLTLALPDGRLRLEVARLDDALLETIILPLRQFEPLLSQAGTGNMAELEQLSDSAARLQGLLAAQVMLDHETARRLFTLVYVLHLKG